MCPGTKHVIRKLPVRSATNVNEADCPGGKPTAGVGVAAPGKASWLVWAPSTTPQEWRIEPTFPTVDVDRPADRDDDPQPSFAEPVKVEPVEARARPHVQVEGHVLAGRVIDAKHARQVGFGDRRWRIPPPAASQPAEIHTRPYRRPGRPQRTRRSARNCSRGSPAPRSQGPQRSLRNRSQSQPLIAMTVPRGTTRVRMPPTVIADTTFPPSDGRCSRNHRRDGSDREEKCQVHDRVGEQDGGGAAAWSHPTEDRQDA